MIVIYRHRVYLDKYRCIDYERCIRVISFAFRQGDLLYYRKNEFEYFVICKEDLIKEVEQ